MPLVYRIDPELNLLYYFGEGDCSISELLKMESVSYRDPLRKPSMKIIVDAQHAFINPTVADLRRVMEMNEGRVRKDEPLEATAFISRQIFVKYMVNTFLGLGKGLDLKFHQFDNLPEAISWLALSEHRDRILQLQSDLKRLMGITVPRNLK